MIKPYISIEIKVRYVDLNKIFRKEQLLAHHRYIDNPEHSKVILKKIEELLDNEGVSLYDNRRGEGV